MPRLTLTFDNGPSPETTPGVLETLADRGLKAYFCVIGRMLARSDGPALAQQAIDDGHIIVNHSMNHQIPLGDDVSVEHARLEILDTQTLLDASLHSWGGEWFRPFGRGGQLGDHLFSPAAVDLLEAGGFSVLLWNSVPRDWEDIDGWVEQALADLDQTDHSVVVLHDLPTGAMKHLPRFLDQVIDRGIEITMDVPDACAPLRMGEATPHLKSLTRALS
jgi:peptidoglycan/xylan/chitin deacetylase (PgdA/CDA1 family)